MAASFDETSGARRALIVAGGTGGHITPGLALALELQRSLPVDFLSLEKNRVYADFQTAPVRFFFYTAPNLSLRPPGVLLLPWRMLRAFLFARRLMQREGYAFVVGCGGYSMAPALLAARSLGLPYYLLEQNVRPGRATRLFARNARAIFANFPLPAAALGAQAAPVVVAGNPLRPAIRSALGADGARADFAAGGPATVLVLGGSQGAQQINEMCLQALAAAPELRRHRWLIQCGEKNIRAMQARLGATADGSIQLYGYVTGVDAMYRAADALICRAGAGVLAEALAFGLPIIAIPYPFAADNHQLENAAYLEAAGAAVCIRRRDSDPAELLAALEGLLADANARRRLSENARALAKPDAAADIAAEILSRTDAR